MGRLELRSRRGGGNYNAAHNAARTGSFKHYMAIAEWAHQDLNRQTKVLVAPTLKFVRSTS